jgi:hypothetical protein
LTPQERGGLRRIIPPRQRALDPTVFELALKRIKPTDRGHRSYDGARAVMVEGRTVNQAIRLHGVSRQAIYQAMDKIEAEFKLLGICQACGRRLPSK